jgi:hypothetical protein
MYRFLDRLEQVSALVLYAWLVLRLWPQDWTALQLYPLTILISEGFVVMLLLVRRPTDTISVQPYDWVIACDGLAGG